MLENFEFYLFLVFVISVLIMLAKKIKVAYPVLLVVAGLLISFIPGTPKIKIEPDLIFIITSVQNDYQNRIKKVAHCDFKKCYIENANTPPQQW